MRAMTGIISATVCSQVAVWTNLKQLSDDALDVVADVSGHREGGAVADGERNVEALSDRLSQKGFAGTSRSEHHDVGLFKSETGFDYLKGTSLKQKDNNRKVIGLQR